MDARGERAQFFQLRDYFGCGTFGILRVDKLALRLRRLDDANFLHPGWRPRKPELLWIGAKLGRTHRYDRLGFRLVGCARFELDRCRDALRASDHRGHRGLDFFKTFIAFALGTQKIPIEFEPSSSGYLRRADQLGDFGTDLSGFRVERVFAEQDQIEFFARQPNRECPRGRERVGAGEGAIFKVHRAVHSHRERVEQCGARLRRSHRHNGGLRSMTSFYLDRERDRTQVVRADDVRSVALDGLRRRVEVGLFDQRNLLDANGNLQHCDTPCRDEAS